MFFDNLNFSRNISVSLSSEHFTCKMHKYNQQIYVDSILDLINKFRLIDKLKKVIKT